jgi:hypothetical protein
MEANISANVFPRVYHCHFIYYLSVSIQDNNRRLSYIRQTFDNDEPKTVRYGV